MEIIKITQERMDQILTPTVKDSDLSKNAKRVLATIINYHLVNDKVRISGFLAINNENLRQSAGIGKEYLRAAVQELIECKLIERKVGQKWRRERKAWLQSTDSSLRTSENQSKNQRLMTSLKCYFQHP